MGCYDIIGAGKAKDEPFGYWGSLLTIEKM